MLILAAVGCWAQSKTVQEASRISAEKSARAEGKEHFGKRHREKEHHRGIAHPPKALVQEPETQAAPPPPPTLAQQPPNAPQVNYRDGLLTVSANNSTMGDILNLVRRKTGADIDYPPTLSQERVAAVVGPAPAPQVLATLLNGTRFDYILMGMNGRPDLLQRAIITASAGGGAVASAAPPPPRTVTPAPADEEEEPEAPPETVEQPEEAPPPQQPAQVPNQQYPQQPQQYPGQQPPQGQQQQPKTPEQLLQELQRMQQQQQQQIQQGQQPQ